MILQFHNVPAEVNFYVDSLPFEKGTFEIDFKGDLNEKYELRGVDLNRQGINLADGTHDVLGGHARLGELVAHTSWKKTKSKAKLTPKTARPYSREKTN